MSNRSIATVCASTAGIVGFVGAFGKLILGMFSYYDDAKDLESAMDLVNDLHISWFPIYLFLFVGSVLYLISLHWKIVFDICNAFASKGYREWNMNAIEIIEYIKTRSYFSASLEQERAYETVVSALQEAAREGRIKLAGRKKGSSKITRITKAECQDLIFSIDGRRAGNILVWPNRINIINRNNPNDRYVLVYADRAEVELVWPKMGS